MNNKNLIIISFCVLLCLIIGGSIFFSSKEFTQYGYELIGQNGGTTSSQSILSTGSLESPSNIGTLAYVNTLEGDVKSIHDGVNTIVTVGTQFSESDIIITGNDSSTEIIFTDNTIVRMDANSRLSFVKLSSNQSEVSLEEGALWARILKPFYDASFFTVSTSDVSAGVQGTSVYLRKNKDKSTRIVVIDSYSENPEKRGAKLRYKDYKNNNWIERQLQPENQFTYTESGTIVKNENITGKTALSDSFIRRNTKLDIIYMDKLMKKNVDKIDFLKRLKGELIESLPKKEELLQFYDEPLLKNTTIFVGSSGVFGDNIPQEFINNVQSDLTISNNRSEIEKLNNSLDNIISLEQGEIIKTKIQERETNLAKVIEQVKEEIKLSENTNSGSNEVITNSGTTGKDAVKEIPINPPVPKSKEVIIPTKIDPPKETIILDKDHDGIQNSQDNCPFIANPNQNDKNRNGIGDACEKIISGETNL